MKITRLRVPAFGVLHSLDTGSTELGGLVLVYGPNESGKSTFFEAITSLLYGFQPASRDRHPYAPWSGDAAEIQAELIGDGEQRLSVDRRLLKTATARVSLGGEDRTLRNRPLDSVESIPRALFRQVFALTSAELSALDSESWAELQERLLSRLGARDIIAAHTVAQLLEEEAGRLWRDNRRGSQRVREIRDEIRKRAEMGREAAGSDRRIRTLSADRDDLLERLQELRTSKQKTQLVIERMTVLLPLRQRLARLAVLEHDAQTGPPLDDLPDDAGRQLRELEKSLSDIEQDRVAQAEDRVDPEQQAQRFTAAMKKVLHCRDEILGAVSAASEVESMETRSTQLDQQLRDLDRRITATSREIFREPLQADAIAQVVAIPIGELRTRIDRWTEASRRVEEARIRDSASSVTSEPAPWEPLAGIAALLLAIGLLVASEGSGLFGALAGLLIGLSIWVGLRWNTARRWRLTAAARRDKVDTPALEVTMAEALQAVHQMMEGLPSRVREPTVELASELSRLQELLADRADRAHDVEEIRRRVGASADTMAALGERLDLDLPAHVGTAVHRLEQHLTSADRAEAAAHAATAELNRIDQRLQAISSRQKAASEARKELLDSLGDFSDGDPDRGLNVVERRQGAAAQATGLRTELEKEFPDFAQLVERIEAAEARDELWLEDDDALVSARTRLEKMEEEIQQMIAKESAHASELQHLEGVMTVDRIDGEILALQEELAETERERDRRVLLACLLRQADQNFRGRHDPDILQRAGEHLSAITGGRYLEVVAPGADLGAPLHVVDLDQGSDLLVEQLSRGTQEQVYFALRLAIMDHLDAEGERLPVLVDDGFANWDPERRGRVFDTLAQASSTRQVFVFTCHPEAAADLRARGASEILLDAR